MTKNVSDGDSNRIDIDTMTSSAVRIVYTKYQIAAQQGNLYNILKLIEIAAYMNDREFGAASELVDELDEPTA